MYSRKRSNIAGITNTLAQTCLLSILILMASAVYAAKNEQLKIEKFSLNRSVAYLGEEVSASVTVSVQPSLRKKTLRLRYYLDRKEIGKQTITSFDPAGNAVTEFSFRDSPEGRYQFRVVLDIEGEKVKTAEVSRQLAILSLPGGMTDEQFSIKEGEEKLPDDPESDRPDLEPVALTFDIASPRIGQKIRMTSRVSNSGAVQADNVKIRIFINGRPHGEDITMNIAAGSQANIETEFIPVSEGKKDILVLINPDGEIDEKSNRNNLISKTLIVRPAKTSRKHEKIVAAPGPSSTKTELANLVVYIETISGVHYTTDGQVRFYITNNSQSGQTKPFMMGVQLLQGSPGKLWLIRQPVKALKSGETVTLSVKWPEAQLSTENLYVATVDIDGNIDETDIRDNHTRPFRVISTATTKPSPALATLPPEIKITRPRQDEHLLDNGKLTVNWKSTGDIGQRVRITVHNNKTKDKILSSVTNNDGLYSVDLSTQDAGEYLLVISDNDSTSTSAKRKFRIAPREPVATPRLISPLNGSSYRGEQLIKIIWPESLKKESSLQLDFVLRESSSKKLVKLNDKSIAASNGELTWRVPDDGSVFGVYSLQTVSPDGRVLAITEEIEILPNFVTVDQPAPSEGKEEIETDVEIARTSFNGPNLEFLVMNNGPADIGVSGMLGYKFTSYFIRKLPVSSEEDVVVCHSTLLADLPQGEGQIVSLGRNPDCPMGEHEYGAKFEYVVNRFTLPKLLNQHLIDPKPLNNISKFYWPD